MPCSSQLIMTWGRFKESHVFVLKTLTSRLLILLQSTSEGSANIIPSLHSFTHNEKNFKRVQNGTDFIAFKTLYISSLRGNRFKKTTFKCFSGKRKKRSYKETAGPSSCGEKLMMDGFHWDNGTIDGLEGRSLFLSFCTLSFELHPHHPHTCMLMHMEEMPYLFTS